MGGPRARIDVMPVLAVPSMFATRAYLNWTKTSSEGDPSVLLDDSHSSEAWTSDDSFEGGSPQQPPRGHPLASSSQDGPSAAHVPPTLLDTQIDYHDSDSSLTVD